MDKNEVDLPYGGGLRNKREKGDQNLK